MLYWVGTHLEEEYDFILTFDLTHEVFEQILLPNNIGTDPENVSFLETNGDFLVMIQEMYMDDEEINETSYKKRKKYMKQLFLFIPCGL